MADIQLLRDVVPSTEGWYCVVALYKGKIKSQSHYKTLEEVEAAADQLVAAGQDALLGVGKFKTDENRTADNCGWLQSFFLDIDCGPTRPADCKRDQSASTMQNSMPPSVSRAASTDPSPPRRDCSITWARSCREWVSEGDESRKDFMSPARSLLPFRALLLLVVDDVSIAIAEVLLLAEAATAAGG
jgi:hypothetical protein